MLSFLEILVAGAGIVKSEPTTGRLGGIHKKPYRLMVVFIEILVSGAWLVKSEPTTGRLGVSIKSHID